MKRTQLLPLAFLLLSTSAITQISAQSIVPASAGDLNIGNYGYPNSATIDYSPNCTGGMVCTSLLTTPEFTAIVQSAGPSGSPLLYVNDRTFLVGWPHISVPLPAMAIADVTVGNDFTTTSDYIVGVVGIGPSGLGNDVFLFTYTVSGVGTGIMTVTLTGTLNVSNTGHAVGQPHIDAEAQYSTSFLGLPQVNNFTVTWQDQPGIMAYASTLNNPTVGTHMVIFPSPHASNPDVAMVERYNPNTFAYEDWALFAYIDRTATPNILFYQEWNIANPPSPTTIYDNTYTYLNYSTGSPIRIDAIDDYNNNNPGPAVYPGAAAPTTAFFDIVAATSTGIGTSAVLEYNNMTGPFTATDITTPVAVINGNANTLPVVACGPAAFYSVGYYSSGIHTGYYATSVDWSTGVTTTDPNAYSINRTPWGPPNFTGLALSATCNADVSGTQELFATWENQGSLWYKYSTFAAPYGFKHTPSAVPAIMTGDTWQLWPNPTTDEATLTAPTGFTARDGDTYHITDLSGRELLHGNISNTDQQISVNSLPAGMYLLNVYTQSAKTNTIKFVKD